MKSFSVISKQAAIGLPPAVPSDIFAKASESYKAWQARKPRSTELPSVWKKKKK
jgi:hypothetical protein